MVPLSIHVSRRSVLAAAAAVPVLGPARSDTPRAVGELDDKIREGMARYKIPGVALGLRYRGRDYVRGYGVTKAGGAAVDGDTVFRVGSTTKTFGGTAILRLVERGKIDLDRPVRHYLPGFRSADAAASARVTVRHLLKHIPGFLGDVFTDTGDGPDALTDYVARFGSVPQLNAPGRQFAYSNSGQSVAGRIIEVVTGLPYEQAVRRLVLEPLRLTHSGYSLDELPGVSVAEPHLNDPATGEPVLSPESWRVPRSIGPAGGLISSARDQLAWARFHMSGGGRLLSARSIEAMRSRPGPGGTLLVELDGYGLTWMIRPSAEGPKIIEHGGDWSGQHSGFLFVPEQDFALTVLTNAESGPNLVADLFASDWALSRFAGLHNLPARERPLSPAEQPGYEGLFLTQQIGFDGELIQGGALFEGSDGRIALTDGTTTFYELAFYRKDYARWLLADGTDTQARTDFDRGPDGTVEWWRASGRLYRRQPAGAAKRTAAILTPPRPTLPYPM
jgi:CubicO group peptidase (beta-lactamase class C family)